MRLALCILARCRLIEDDDRSILEDSSSYRYALTLTSREATTILPYLRLIPLGQPRYKVVTLRQPSSLKDLGICRLFASDANVFSTVLLKSTTSWKTMA